jgi:hypothetical protein
MDWRTKPALDSRMTYSPLAVPSAVHMDQAPFDEPSFKNLTRLAIYFFHQPLVNDDNLKIVHFLIKSNKFYCGFL